MSENMTFSHRPVLLSETIDNLVHDPDGLYVDGTAGGGGHSAAILARLSEKGRLVCIDQDPDAIKTVTERFKDDDYAFSHLITPMLKAIAREIPRICKDHPEAPRKLLDFFYSKYDYYFINPIDALEITRIGAINVHHGLGCIPGNKNHYTPTVDFPTELLDVRFATGPHGEISRDTIQLSFDGGWAVCLTVIRNQNEKYGRFFAIKAYLPVTPFGSYRDQVEWDPEA